MAKRTYINHRDSQRERILTGARDLFVDRGISAVTLGEVAAAAGITRATLYKYFTNKEQLARALFQNTTRGWVERGAREVWPLPGTGFERVERFVTSHCRAMFREPREARFVAEFNALYAREWPVEQMAPLLTETLGGERLALHASVVQGQGDGSLRVDLPPDELVAQIFNFVSGMMDRFGAMGDKVAGEYGVAAQTVFEGINRVFLDGLRGRSSGCQPKPGPGRRLKIA